MRLTGRERDLLRYLMWSIAVSWVLALARDGVPSSQLSRLNNEVAGHYLGVIGILYAVLLGFVVLDVWSEFHDAQKNVVKEANALADLSRIVEGFPEEARTEPLYRLLCYSRAVAGAEWPLMQRGAEGEDRPKPLQKLWSALAKVNVTTMRDQASYAQALQRFVVISETRSLRLLHGKPGMPPQLWALLLFVGAITVGSMYFFEVDPFWVHGLMITAMISAIGIILFLIADLDNPFTGVYFIRTEPIDRVTRRLKELVGTKA